MRYLPHTPEEIQEMLKTVGAASIDELFASIPEALRFSRSLDLPPSLSEPEIRSLLGSLSHKNTPVSAYHKPSFLGAGSYYHTIPSIVSQLLLRGEFLTAYTPYQPEVAQGTLQAIFEYQTMVCEILGMDVSNASHYDGSTATAEAALMGLNITRRKKILIASSLHPEYRETLRTYIQDPEIVVEEIPFAPDGTLDRQALKKSLTHDVGCVVVGYPNFFGILEDVSDIAEQAHQMEAVLVTVTTEPVCLGLAKSPGEMGSDIAVAEGQSFGNSLNFGGPGLGFFATRHKYVRAMPGRLVGETDDVEGHRGYVLTLATREQHIRREKASSNICTNVALCALAATITLTSLGKQGFQDLAQLNLDRAALLREELASSEASFPFGATTFNEFVFETRLPATKILERMLEKGVIAGLPLSRWYPGHERAILVCATEMNTEEQIQQYGHVFRKTCRELGL